MLKGQISVPEACRKYGFYRDLAKSYGLQQEVILPHTSEQNGVAESFIGTPKLECIWQYRFKTFEEAKLAIESWMDQYNDQDHTHASATSRRSNGAAGEPK